MTNLKTPEQWEEYEKMVEAVMNELGCDHSDAEAVVDAKLKEGGQSADQVRALQFSAAYGMADANY